MSKSVEEPQPTKQPSAANASKRLLRIVTRCASIDEFVALYGEHTDAESMFVNVKGSPSPEKQAFSILLSDGTIVMSGQATVSEECEGEDGSNSRCGLRLRFVELDEPSRQMHQELLAAQFADPPTDLQPVSPKPASRRENGARAESVSPPTPVIVRAPSPVLITAGSVRVAQLPLPGLPPPPSAAFDPGCSPAKRSTPSAAAPSDVTKTDESEWARRLALARACAEAAAAPAPAVSSNRSILRATLTTTALAAVGLGLGYGFWGGAASALGPTAPKMVASDEPEPEQRSIRRSAITPPVTQPPPPHPAAPVAASCTARITSSPSGARVTWNGKTLGSTPVDNATVPCGQAVVVWQHLGYARATARVSAAVATPIVLSRRLKRAYHRLSLSSRPPGAVFRVDGRVVGPAPVSVWVPESTSVTVRANKRGFVRWSKRVKVHTRKLSLRITLTPLPRTGPKNWFLLDSK